MTTRQRLIDHPDCNDIAHKAFWESASQAERDSKKRDRIYWRVVLRELNTRKTTRYLCGCPRNIVEHHDDDCEPDCASDACVNYDMGCSTHQETR